MFLYEYPSIRIMYYSAPSGEHRYESFILCYYGQKQLRDKMITCFSSSLGSLYFSPYECEKFQVTSSCDSLVDRLVLNLNNLLRSERGANKPSISFSYKHKLFWKSIYSCSFTLSYRVGIRMDSTLTVGVGDYRVGLIRIIRSE